MLARSVAAVLLAVAFVAGCSSDDSDDPTVPTDAPTESPTESPAESPGDEPTGVTTPSDGSSQLGSIDGPASVDPSFDPLGSTPPPASDG